MSLPYVVASCAMSLDACLDDGREARLVLSHPADLERVDALRASCDAILVGAHTIRRDNPRLVVRAPGLVGARQDAGRPPQPIKATVTASGDLDAARAFFTEGPAERVVYVAGEAARIAPGVRRLATVVAMPPGATLRGVVEDLERRGVRRLLVEGGARVLTAVLSEDLVDELQVAIAPYFLAQPGAVRVVGEAPMPFGPGRRMPVRRVSQVGDMVVAVYQLRGAAAPTTLARDDDRRWLADAVALSRRCPPSVSAFSVGAIVVGEGEVVATGYSREESPVEHAEETAIRRAWAAGLDLSRCTIYSSLEPCASRASGRTACCDRIAAAGLRRVGFASVEPPIFVPGRGAERLRALGIEVRQIDDLAAEVRAVNAHLPWR